jgi:MoaA/NifB/PqqE/SkfB family radical SAM enzyme
MFAAGIRRTARAIGRRYRETKMFAKAMASSRHPVLAQIVPIRRCNLSCAYCNEYDDVSPPAPAEKMLRRIDRLAELGTTIITFSGGEPFLHPDLDALIRRVRSHGAIATVITNGYLLTPDRIKRLNRAGLDYMQISIDNVLPDAASKKSLKVLDRKLEMLARHAEFGVTINSVLGNMLAKPEDAYRIALRARELGFQSTVGVLHDHGGQLLPLAEELADVWKRIFSLSGALFSFAHFDRFQQNIVRGRPNNWHCRAGSRFLYICEDGLVHYCSQQRGQPGIPIEEYTQEHLDRAFHQVKPCAPFCTISCVHQVAMLDAFREQPRETLAAIIDRRKARDPRFEPPRLARLLNWMFLESSRRGVFGKLALRVLGVAKTPRG